MTIDEAVIAVFAEDMFEDLELWYPLLRLQEAAAEVRVIGPKAGATYSGKRGLSVTSDSSIDAANPSDYNALVIPGGYAPDRMRRHAAMIEFTRQMHAQNKLIAAICHAGWVPISAGIVQGKTVTSFWSIADDLRNAGAEWVDRDVVRDGNLITSRYPDDLPAFCRSIIGALTATR